MLRTLTGMTTELEAVASGETGHVRVAFTGLAMRRSCPGILREFNRRFPGIRLELNESPTSAQLAALQTATSPAAFPSRRPHPGLRTRLLLRERNGVLLPAGHPLEKKTPLRLRNLAATPFVLFPRKHNPAFTTACWRPSPMPASLRPLPRKVWPRANSIGLVRAGLGATFMTPSEAQHLPPEVSFHPLAGPGAREPARARLAPAPGAGSGPGSLPHRGGPADKPEE